MAGLAIPVLQVPVTENAQLESHLCSQGLKVVEIYSEWAGPCKSVVPTFRRIRLDKDDETALLFLTVAAYKCDFLEACREFKMRCEPLFLLYRNGQLKAKVEGANAPLLSSHILALTPANAGIDDLEENPMYLARAERERIARGELAKDKGGKKKK